MKKIEDIIKANKNAFDSDEPTEGHFDKFNLKLQKRKRNITTLYIYKFLKVAGVAILVLLSSFYIYENFIQKHQDSTILNNLSPEYKEAEMYYVSIINSKFNQIQAINFKEPEHKKILLKELKEMDSLYDSLQNDLQLNPNDERIINSMINFYQLRIEVLNNIIEQLRLFNSNNAKQDEKIKI